MSGSVGGVVAGPNTADGLTWWQIRYPDITGWSAEDYLAPAAVNLQPDSVKILPPTLEFHVQCVVGNVYPKEGITIRPGANTNLPKELVIIMNPVIGDRETTLNDQLRYRKVC
jgi:hypothetical protein